MSNLKQQLIRLGSDRPDLQEDIHVVLDTLSDSAHVKSATSVEDDLHDMSYTLQQYAGKMRKIENHRDVAYTRRQADLFKKFQNSLRNLRTVVDEIIGTID